ncbi:L,D-transpeptidase family protein [Sulfurimonas sp.]
MANKFYFLFILFLTYTYFSTNLAASELDILTNYRLNGINNIEKQMDKELANKSYWSAYLKNKDMKFGYIESYKNILTCNKSKSNLLVYAKDSNNTYKLTKVYSAYTGKEKGDKEKEGDLKTPIGVYNLVKKISNVDEFYGPLAFVTSYPNIYDKYEGKTGKGIWIHGLPIHEKRDKFTKGCIAIGNKSIECLNKHIDMDKTLLIINKQCNYKKVNINAISQVLSQIYAWRYAWKYNNLKDYLNFYSDDFIRFDGMKIKKFKSYKKRIFAKNEKKSIIFKNLNVIPYPTHKDTYKVMFDEEYKSNSFSFKGKKILIVQLIASQMKIITEK